MRKYLLEGGDPDFRNLDVYEQTKEEFEYHLLNMLNDYTQEERYRQIKEMYCFHPSYTEMEKLDHWEDRANVKYCNGQQCIRDCSYCKENGRIEDEQVIGEYLEGIDIVEIEDYKKELGKVFINAIIVEWSSSEK